MGTVWAVLLVIGMLVPVFALLATGAWVVRLARRVRALDARARPPWQRLLDDRAGGPPGRPWGLAAFFTLTGLLLPWTVGVGVKLYLDAAGRPTLPYSDFLSFSETPVLLVISLMTWSFPFPVLSALLLARKTDSGRAPGARRILPLWLAYGVGVAVAIPVFVGVFWEFDAIYLIMPVGMLLLVPMAAAYGLGTLLARRPAPIEARGARGLS